MGILVINAGSSSLKFELFDAEAGATLAMGSSDWSDPARSRADPPAVNRARGPDEDPDPGHRPAVGHAIRALVGRPRGRRPRRSGIGSSTGGPSSGRPSASTSA